MIIHDWNYNMYYVFINVKYLYFLGAFFSSICAYGHHLCTKDTNDGCVTFDYCVEADFDQSSHAIHHVENIIEGKLGYVGKIQDIILVDFSSFQCVSLRCKWWDTFNRNNVKEYCDSELICINSRNMWDECKETCVFPKHCNQVFFYPYVFDIYW